MVLQREGIVMESILNATEVRKEWGKFIDNVVRFKPSMVKRNRDYFAAISLEHLESMLSPYRFTLEYEKEDDNSLSGSLEEIDIVENAKSLEELKTKISQELIDYAHEYLDDSISFIILLIERHIFLMLCGYLFKKILKQSRY